MTGPTWKRKLTYMRNIELPNKDAKPVIVSAIAFDPWPFHDTSVRLHGSINYIDSSGRHLRNSPYYLHRDKDNIIVTLSDGTQCVTNGEGMKAYSA